MRPRILNGIAIGAALVPLLTASGPLEAQEDVGKPVHLQVECLAIQFPDSLYDTTNPLAFSPFLTFDVAVFSRLSLRFGLSPPLGVQAYATNLALSSLWGKGPSYLELGIGSYYQNTWCNGRPDRKAYTAYVGWRRRGPDRLDLRFGALVGATAEGSIAVGIGFSIGGWTGTTRF